MLRSFADAARDFSVAILRISACAIAASIGMLVAGSVSIYLAREIGQLIFGCLK